MRYIAVEDNYGKWCVVDMEHPQWKSSPHPMIIADDLTGENAELLADARNAREVRSKDQAS